MNLRRPNSNAATGTHNRSRSVVPMSGLCADCLDGCQGKCDIWLSSLRGREVLYPGPYPEVTAGADKDYPLDYSHLNIQGYAVGARGLDKPDPDKALFTKADTETEYGWDKKVKLKIPIFTGALGSTFIAQNNWEEFAIGAAITGITLVCGENVCGVDPQLKLDSDKKVASSPEMDRRIETYNRFHEGYGEILVQMNVEDTRLGVAEYVSSKHELETLELKWGQGAKCIGGEIRVKEIERARQLKERGYLVTPDPTQKDVEKAYKDGAIKEFERHSRLGFVTKEAFMDEVDRLHDLGFKRVTLKTGAYSMVELAMAMKFSSEAKIDLLTIDGAPGGTGMSPWPMMCEWGVPTFYLQSLAIEFADNLKKQGLKVPDLAIAGGFSDEANVYKALAMGDPYVKAVCMGRGLMIPGMLGKNITKWMKDGKLPASIKKYGTKPEEIFLSYDELEEKYGSDMKDIPLGAVALYTYGQKFKTGLQQLLAGSRNFNLGEIGRKDLMALTREASEVSGIPYVTEAYREEALKILEE